MRVGAAPGAAPAFRAIALHDEPAEMKGCLDVQWTPDLRIRRGRRIAGEEAIGRLGAGQPGVERVEQAL